MSQRSSALAPPNVLTALEQLKSATSPTELGHAYRTVSTWRKESRTWHWPPVGWFLWFAHAGLIICVMEFLWNRYGASDFWRGALYGMMAVRAADHILELFSFDPFGRRVNDALGRWRHLVPLMRELP